jgi:hypothetical protein
LNIFSQRPNFSAGLAGKFLQEWQPTAKAKPNIAQVVGKMGSLFNAVTDGMAVVLRRILLYPHLSVFRYKKLRDIIWRSLMNREILYNKDCNASFSVDVK